MPTKKTTVPKTAAKTAPKTAAKTAQKKAEQTKAARENEFRVRIDRLFSDTGKKLKATASVNLEGGFAVHGIKIYEGEKGLFVAMPQASYKSASGETKYEDIFHPVTAEARQNLVESVTEAYDRSLEKAMTAQEPELSQ